MAKFTKEDNSMWQKELGISSMNNIDSVTVNEIMEMPAPHIEELPLRDLQVILIALSRYKMFLVREIGLLKAKLDTRTRRLDIAVNLAAAKSNASSKDERRAYALSHDANVGELLTNIEEIEAKYSQLRNLPDAVQGFIDKIDRLEYRKANEYRTEEKLHD